ncbi:hypothetical protein UlMin_039486 [Ulmus minor]
MIVPVTSPHTNPKSDSSNTTNPNHIGFRSPTHIPNLCYEPTSVLDLGRSPSPVAGKPTKVSAAISEVLSQAHSNDPLELDEQVDWDFIMRDLGLHDDNSNALKDPNTPSFSEFHHPQPFDPTHFVHSDFNLSELYSTQSFSNNSNASFEASLINDHFLHPGNSNVIGFDFVEDLIRAAECFDSEDLQLAQAILERQRSSPAGKPFSKPLQRAALYFKEALYSLITGSNQRLRLSTWSEIVQTIKAHKSFCDISPIPMFAYFTTNQALLEALNGMSFIHVIDFDIGLGNQYASLMKEFAEKADAVRLNPPVLRITAVVPEEYEIETRLIRESLSQFAQELKIRFQIDFVPIRTFEMLSFKSVKFMEGEKMAILLSTGILRRLGSTGFLTDVRRLSPAAVVVVDGEGWGEAGATSPSFRRNFVCSLQFYSMIMESLDAAMVGGECVRRIENFILRPRIQAAVEAAERRVTPWREMFQGAGMRPVQLSHFADFQAECLLGKLQVRGFDVAKRQADLVLCWHELALVATSVWRF